MKKKNNTIIIAAAIIIGAYLISQGGSFNFNFIGQGGQVPSTPDQSNIDPTYFVTLSFNPSNICVGETTQGRIGSNMPNGVCSVFLNTGSGWSFFMNANLDANGGYIQNSPAITVVGSARFRAVCRSTTGKFGVSPEAMLVSEMCDDEPSEIIGHFKCCHLGTQADCFQDTCPLGWSLAGSFDVVDAEATCNQYCSPVDNECVDTDGGNDIYHKGVCSSPTAFPNGIADYCEVGSYLAESYCVNGVCMGSSYPCPTGYYCSDGACVIQPMQTSCSSIIRPTSQRSCDVGTCSSGTCIYHPATIVAPSSCLCG